MFADNYNNRVHSTTKKKPLDLATDPMLTVPHKHTSSANVKAPPPIGSFVRLNRDRSIFDKEASGTWTKEIFQVARHNLAQPIPLVTMHDLTDKPIAGSFYPEEYQVIDWHGKKVVDQVLRKRRAKGHQERLVTYEGWPATFTEWIPMAD